MATEARAEDSWWVGQGELNVARSWLSIAQTSARSAPLGSGRSAGPRRRGDRPASDPECGVAWNGDVVLATFDGGQSEMATGLAGDPVPEIGEGRREIVTGDVPRKPQALMTSSRTKWSRMTFGTLSSLK